MTKKRSIKGFIFDMDGTMIDNMMGIIELGSKNLRNMVLIGLWKKSMQKSMGQYRTIRTPFW